MGRVPTEAGQCKRIKVAVCFTQRNMREKVVQGSYPAHDSNPNSEGRPRSHVAWKARVNWTNHRSPAGARRIAKGKGVIVTQRFVVEGKEGERGVPACSEEGGQKTGNGTPGGQTKLP